MQYVAAIINPLHNIPSGVKDIKAVVGAVYKVAFGASVVAVYYYACLGCFQDYVTPVPDVCGGLVVCGFGVA